MRRRELLAAGAAAVGGLSGCPELFNDEFETYSPDEYSFAGVVVIAHGISINYQPFTITAKLRSDGEIVTEKSTTVQDANNEVVQAIYKRLSPHTKYVITLIGPDCRREMATDELRRDTEERFVGERVGYMFTFRDPSYGFSFEPCIVSDDWPESGVALWS